MAIRFRNWNRIQNCGDAITSYIFKHVLGTSGYYTAGGGKDHLLATGSILGYATPLSHVWGSGIRDPKLSCTRLDPNRIHAVRGHHTLARLRQDFPGLSTDLPLGDPGVLIGRLPQLAGKRATAPRHRFAVVPHHTQMEGAWFRELAGSPEVRLVDMRDNSLTPARDIAAAEIVISSSLHGLIFATALDKPCVWISDRRDSTWAFKFLDWFSTVERPQETPLPMGRPLEDYAAAAQVRPFARSSEALISAFPGDAPGLQVTRPIVDFEAQRAVPWVTVQLSGPLPLAELSVESLAEDETVRLRYRETAMPAYALLESWAEPPYLCIMGQGAAADTATMAQIVTLMDHDHQTDGLVLLDGGTGEAGAGPLLEPAERVRPAGLVLRPGRGPVPLKRLRRYGLPAT